METNLKKFAWILGAFCFSAASLSAGSYDTDDEDNQQNVAVPPAKYGSGEDAPSVFVSVDYTLWTARQDGLALAVDNYYATSTASPQLGSFYYPDWKLRSGFKVGLGANVHHDGWDVQAEYTWFYNNNNSLKQNFSGAAGQAVALKPTDLAANSILLNAASSKFDNWFNRIDAELARSFYAGHYLTYRPWLGILGAWDKQKYQVNYTDNDGGIVRRLRWSQKWWGIGPYAGTDAGFYITKEWIFFITSGVSLPWSKAQPTVQGQSCGTANTTCTTDYYSQGTFWNVEPMVELSLGLRWETWWSDHTWSFMLQAGWEEQVWFNHNHMDPAGVGANYTMQGLTIKAQANF